MRSIFIFVFATALFFLSTRTELRSATPRNFLPISISYSWPSGGLTQSLGAQPALGFSLGYQFALEQNFRFTARGTWSRMELGNVDTSDFTSNGITHVGLTAGLQYLFIKHGFTPYAEVEGGMGYLFTDQLIANQPIINENLNIVKLSAAVSVGLLIPLSAKVDIDIRGRYSTTAVSQGFGTISAHLGASFALR